MNRTIDQYMDRRAGRAVSSSQKLAIKEWDEMTEQLKQMRMQIDILHNCGLDKEAAKIQEQANDLEIRRRAYEDKLNEERKLLARDILLVLAACDVATVVADTFAADIHKLSRGYYGDRNSFSESVKEQATSFNKIVQTIDEAEHERMSMFYADMAEEATSEAIKAMRAVIQRWCETAKGKQYF